MRTRTRACSKPSIEHARVRVFRMPCASGTIYDKIVSAIGFAAPTTKGNCGTVRYSHRGLMNEHIQTTRGP